MIENDWSEIMVKIKGYINKYSFDAEKNCFTTKDWTHEIIYFEGMAMQLRVWQDLLKEGVKP